VNAATAGDDPRPVAPVRPSADDCCQGGCARCVYDLYEDALDRYRVELAAWSLRHAVAQDPPG
jgi:Oxidoreductase-like protein, N-terminal